MTPTTARTAVTEALKPVLRDAAESTARRALEAVTPVLEAALEAQGRRAVDWLGRRGLRLRVAVELSTEDGPAVAVTI
jgi:hypothetical protein